MLMKGSVMSTHQNCKLSYKGILSIRMAYLLLEGSSTLLWGQTQPLAFHERFLKGKERQLISASDLWQAVRGQQGVEVLPITVIIIAVVIITIMLQIHLMVTTGPGLQKRLKKKCNPCQEA